MTIRLAVLIACLIINSSALAVCISVLDTQLYIMKRTAHSPTYFVGNEAGRFLRYVNDHSTGNDIHGNVVIALHFQNGSASAAAFKNDCLIDTVIQLDRLSFDKAVEAAHHGEL